MDMGFDVIVVGSGAGGAVVARRVAEDAGASVLLLEAGGPDLNPAIHDPARVHELWLSDEDWAYHTEPQLGLGGRRVHWPRGKVLGGSTTFHGMMWFRGWAGDYDHWAYLGNEGWRYEDVLPLFRRSEDFDGGAVGVPRRGRAAPGEVAVRAPSGQHGGGRGRGRATASRTTRTSTGRSSRGPASPSSRSRTGAA